MPRLATALCRAAWCAALGPAAWTAAQDRLPTDPPPPPASSQPPADVPALQPALDRPAKLGPARPDRGPAPDPAVRQVANVVARVDDHAILIQDLIAPIRPKLELMKQQLPPAEYAKAERAELKAQADRMIERAILLKEAEGFVKDKKRLDAIKGSLEKEFQRFLRNTARENNIRPEDLPEQLQREGTSIELLRREFTESQLALGFFEETLKGKQPEPGRPELLEYYQTHKAEFQRDAKCVWRDLEVKIGADPRRAAERVHQADQRLRAGEAFAAVAKELSDGPTAADGGRYPVTRKGSFYDPVVDEALFSVPLGRPSAILRGKDSFHIVLVEERTADGVLPFADVQQDIAKKLKDERRLAQRKQRLAEMRKRHFVESIFDDADVATAPPGSALRR